MIMIHLFCIVLKVLQDTNIADIKDTFGLVLCGVVCIQALISERQAIGVERVEEVMDLVEI